ncbi:MAG: biopolymer transporter ExbD [Thermoguttaceae bacterium]|nr:biopolymer transporter ExbD [Thermoguttaceae bacterium]
MPPRKRRRKDEEVELNLAAMLDMAFQLLAFFILTFRPSPVEGQVSLRMPPPQPVTMAVAGEQAGSNPNNTNPVQGLNSLVITVLGSPSGRIYQMAVGDAHVAHIIELERRLKTVLSDPGVGFDQVLIQVGATLRYDELMKVIDVCTRQKLPNGEPLSKLSFVELPGPESGAE